MLLNFLATVVFLISIWTNSFVVVRWEGIPQGDTQVFCSFDGPYSSPETVELNRFTWTNNSQDGEWIAFHDFLEPQYSINCLGFLDNVPVTITAHTTGVFPDNGLVYLPFIN